MSDYKRMYIAMFRASELAIRSLENDESKENALFILKLAQAHCENIYITANEDDPKT